MLRNHSFFTRHRI